MLTKSHYLLGKQCLKLVWFAFNEPHRFPEPDDNLQAVFDQGHLVGEYAKKLFDGVEVQRGLEFEEKIALTKELLAKKKTIYEAVIIKDNLYAQPDILTPMEDGWELIEVKSGTSVKEVNVEDVAFQKYLLGLYGTKVIRTCLLHINNRYVRQGQIEPRQLFTKTELSPDTDVKAQIENILKTVSGPMPDIKIGPQCNYPYACPLQYICWSFLPERNASTLHGFRKTFEMFGQGIYASSDVPMQLLNHKQQIQVQAESSGKEFVNRFGITDFLKKIKYPLYFLDFESFDTAIPILEGTRPYQKVVFQYSLHIVEQKGGGPRHFGEIFDGDPRLPLLGSLKKNLGQKGTILVYNAGFERPRLRELSLQFPKHKKWIDSVLDRIVDLAEPFRDFYYYHPDQKGSYSIKSLLPAVTKKNYENLQISDGQEASRQYLRAVAPQTGEEERAKIFNALEEYCSLDTMAMVEILEKLYSVVKD